MNRAERSQWLAMQPEPGEGGAYVCPERPYVRPQFAQSLPERAQEVAQAHVAARNAEAAEAFRGEAAGLVPVPTSGSDPAALLEERRAARRSEVGALELDPAARRLTALRAAVGWSARAFEVGQAGHRPDVAWMVTLTYRDGCEWQARHVSDAIRELRKWCKRKAIPLRYVWIAELQDGKRRADGRGRMVIHYHLVVWLPPGVRAPHFDRRGWWPHGMSEASEARSGAGYLISYAKKTKDLSGMPKGARAYGIGGLDVAARRGRWWLRLPAMVRGRASVWDRWRRAPGGGWSDPSGGVLASEWQRVNVGGRWCCVRVAEHERVIEAAGPFSWLSDRETALAAA